MRDPRIENPAGTAATVAIVGGGLAGLAAGCALADVGFRVTVLERRPYLGGRASSYQHPGTGEVIDNCQHVLLGCCTNLIEFYRRLGVAEKIRWYDQLTFIEPGGRTSSVGSSFLPAPLHSAPSFLRAAYLGFSDKVSVAGALATLARTIPKDNGETFQQWLQLHHQPSRAIEHFWKPVLVSALNEDLDRISVPYAAQVFRESFLKSSEAGRMGVPMAPLTELYSEAGRYITERGGEVRYRSGVDSLEPEQSEVKLSVAGQKSSFDFALIAVSYDAVARLLPVPADALRGMLSHFESSPITGIHLWFDRQITELDHAILLDRTIQWMFHKSRILQKYSAAQGDSSYLELVVSASKSLVEKSKTEIVELALRELQEFFPAARDARLVKSAVVKEIHATYSPLPGVDAYRPAAQTAWPRVFLAGDYTVTGWPATMEGAVRSGYIAAGCVAKAAGMAKQFVLPDLPASGLMRLFGQN